MKVSGDEGENVYFIDLRKPRCFVNLPKLWAGWIELDEWVTTEEEELGTKSWHWL